LFIKEDKDISIEISDNGIGFDTAIIQQKNQGIGFQNIYSRARLINTAVSIESKKGAGTKMILKLKTQ
jgi:signal transduction histidine kinase